MPWDLCIRRSSSLASQMAQLFNLLFQWKDLFHIEKELQGCTRLYLLHLLRYFFQIALLTKCLEPAVSDKLTNALSSIVQVVIEFPYVFAQAIIYSSIFYSMGSFVWTVDRFIWYLFFMYLTMLYFTFYGMMTTAVTPNHHVAAIIGAPCYMLWNLFSGFMIPHKVWKLMLYCFHLQFRRSHNNNFLDYLDVENYHLVLY